jgi:fatty acid desaturase
MFKHAEDRIPVALIVCLTLVDLALYFTVQSPWVLAAYALLMVVPKGCVGAWSHHHQHVATFRKPVLNRLLELSHALHTGMTSNLWVLHHVLGHHVNYLDQTKDESGWQRKDGTKMGALEYTLDVTFTAYWRAFNVGKRYPKHQRVFLLGLAMTSAAVGALFWFNPVSALILFAFPMLSSMLFTAWVTYDHHSGLETANPYEGSINTLNKRFNVITGNLGFHTAHHLKQSVHWSKLPDLHRTIAHKIPAHLFRKSEFALLLGIENTDYGAVELADEVSTIKPMVVTNAARTSSASGRPAAQRDVA